MRKLVLTFIFCALVLSCPIKVQADAVLSEDILFSEKEALMDLVYDEDYFVKLDGNDVDILAKVLYGEAGGIDSTTEQAAVVWCILNRVDSADFPDSINDVVKQPCQFDGYSDDFPVREDLREIAVDVLRRWNAEKEGYFQVGRVLPKSYLYFMGDGAHNHFTSEWGCNDEWDFDIPSPYFN